MKRGNDGIIIEPHEKVVSSTVFLHTDVPPVSKCCARGAERDALPTDKPWVGQEKGLHQLLFDAGVVPAVFPRRKRGQKNVDSEMQRLLVFLTDERATDVAADFKFDHYENCGNKEFSCKYPPLVFNEKIRKRELKKKRALAVKEACVADGIDTIGRKDTRITRVLAYEKACSHVCMPRIMCSLLALALH